VIIFISSSIPRLSLPKIGFVAVDKVVHFFIFLMFCALTHRAIKFQSRYPLASKYSLAFSMLFTILYGMIDEGHQYFVPGRDASLLDLAADAFGALLYVGTLWAWSRFKHVPDESR
jgi:VanZ family protein